jgi:hypothetical protein
MRGGNSWKTRIHLPIHLPTERNNNGDKPSEMSWGCRRILVFGLAYTEMIKRRGCHTH